MCAENVIGRSRSLDRSVRSLLDQRGKLAVKVTVGIGRLRLNGEGHVDGPEGPDASGHLTGASGQCAMSPVKGLNGYIPVRGIN